MTGPELLALLAEEEPRTQIAASSGLAETLGTPPDLARFNALVEIETALLFAWDPIVRLAALLPSQPVPVAAAAVLLGLSDADRRRLIAALPDPTLRIVSFLSPREMRRALYRIGAQAFRDRVLLAWAGSTRTAAAAQWRMLHVYAETWTVPEFPISDAEIRAAGVRDGALMGEVRREVESWWIDLDFTDDKMAAVERLKSVAQGLTY